MAPERFASGRIPTARRSTPLSYVSWSSRLSIVVWSHTWPTDTSAGRILLAGPT